MPHDATCTHAPADAEYLCGFSRCSEPVSEIKALVQILHWTQPITPSKGELFFPQKAERMLPRHPLPNVKCPCYIVLVKGSLWQSNMASENPPFTGDALYDLCLCYIDL